MQTQVHVQSVMGNFSLLLLHRGDAHSAVSDAEVVPEVDLSSAFSFCFLNIWS